MAVNWDAPRIQERRVKGKTRRVSVYAVDCPECGQERWLTASDARRAEAQHAICHRCAQTAKGRLGYAATARKHGDDFALEAVRNYRLSHPSRLEAQVSTLLDDLGITYQREVRCGRYLLDFVVGHRAIEVNGYVHRWHAERDQRKAAATRQAGYELLILNTADIPNAHTLLTRYLEAHHAV